MKIEGVMPGVLEILLANIDEAYLKRGWHGANLRGSLRGLRGEVLVWRPATDRHNIWELALHAAYWKYAVRRRLSGAKRGSFPLPGSNWFASPESADAAQWRAVVQLLDQEHGQLREVVAGLREPALRDRKRLQLIYGIAAHDLYHTGQIQLIKRLYGSAA